MRNNFCIINPFSETDLTLLKEFAKNNNLNTKIISFYNFIKESKTEEEYQKEIQEQNNIIQSLYIKDGSFIKDCCFLEGQRDIKKCTITFSPLLKQQKSRILLQIATDYALNTLNMEEVFIALDKKDTSLLKILKDNNYENLGDINGMPTYLKEKSIL